MMHSLNHEKHCVVCSESSEIEQRLFGAVEAIKGFGPSGRKALLEAVPIVFVSGAE